MSLTAKFEYQRGAGLYKAHHYAAAAEAFSVAYAKYPSTRLLYDLGQSYRKDGQLQPALQSYEAYLSVEHALSPAMLLGIRSHIGQLRTALGKPVSGPIPHPRSIPELLDPTVGRRPRLRRYRCLLPRLPRRAPAPWPRAGAKSPSPPSRPRRLLSRVLRLAACRPPPAMACRPPWPPARAAELSRFSPAVSFLVSG